MAELTSTPLWRCESVRLEGIERPRLDGVTLEIGVGVTAVIGYSGAGKTSLLNLLVQFERPDRGEIEYSKKVATGDRLPLFWVPQDGGLWPHLTVRDHLAAVSNDSEEIDRLLERFDLLDLASAKPGRLSLGERSRLSVARALAANAQVLVMDEPLVHVDPARSGRFWNVLIEHCQTNDTSLVFATHEPESVLAYASRVVCLKDGRVEYAGSVSKLYQQPDSEELARYLGPVNWFDSSEDERWLAARDGDHPCVRAERLSVEPSEEGPLVVQSSRFAGSMEEVELKHETTGIRKRFVHRPPGRRLRSGDRVCLKLLGWLCCLVLSGCGTGEESTLDVREFRAYSLPAMGRTLPAPRSVAVGPEGNLYVLDNGGRVLVYGSAGRVIREWMMPEYDVGKPEGVCVFQDGRIAVTDTHYHRVVFFNEVGEVTGTLGEYGHEPGQFVYPVGVVQDEDGDFYVCEYGEFQDRVQKFSVEGEFLLEFGANGTEPGEFQRPSGMVWHDGRIYVADAVNNRIQVFTDEGKFLQILGSREQSVALHYPYDLALDDEGNLLVVEYGSGRVTRLDLNGELVDRYGSSGRGDGQFITPWGVTASGRRIYVADTGNRRIVELRL